MLTDAKEPEDKTITIAVSKHATIILTSKAVGKISIAKFVPEFV